MAGKVLARAEKRKGLQRPSNPSLNICTAERAKRQVGGLRKLRGNHRPRKDDVAECIYIIA